MCARLDIRCEEYSPSLVFRDDTLAVKRRSQMFQAQRWAAIKSQDRQREMHRSRSSGLRDEANNTDCDSSTSGYRPWSSQSPDGQQMHRRHQPDSMTPEERTRDFWDQHDHMPSPLATSPAQNSGVTMHWGTEHSPVSLDTDLLSVSTPRSHGLESRHLAGRPAVCRQSTIAGLSDAADAAAASAIASPIQEAEQEKIVERTQGHSKAPLSIPSPGPGNPSPGSALAHAGHTAVYSSRPAQPSHLDSPILATGLVLLHSSTPSTDAMTPTDDQAGLDDWWLNRSDMPGLPSIYKYIWDSFGHSNEAFRYALLGLVPASLPNRCYSTTERSRRIEFYSMALRAMTQTRQGGGKTSGIAVELTILSLFLLLEMRFGTFEGGFTHCTRSDFLVAQNYGRLAEWHIGRELLCTWMCTRSWYHSQVACWRASAAGPSESLRQLLAPILRTSPKRSQPLMPLLSQCWHISEQVILARLVGVNGHWPGFRYWCRQLESLGLQPPAPDSGMYGDPSVTEEQRLAQLEAMRAELDDWHSTLTTHDFPMLTATSKTMVEIQKQPRALRSEPLCFRNHQAALNYLRYAAAQALCSKEAIETLTGGILDKELQTNRWINLCLRIINGLDRQVCLEANADEIDLMWIVGRAIIGRGCQDMAVLETIESWLPWLEEVSAIPGSTCPAWCLRRLLNKVREESARGRHLLAFFLGIESSSDWTDIHSSGSSEKYEKMLIVGRVMETGLPFHEITGY